MDKDIIPRVSVLMPVYNAELYVGEAIESILNQSYTDFEFIILNDGSTDKSEEIILSYQDQRIRYYKNAQNLKLPVTLNKGIEQAKGEYIARMDSDDIALPERLMKQIHFLDQNPEVGVCGSNVELFGKWNFITDLSNTSHDIDAELLLKNPVFHSTVMFRKSLILESGIKYNPSFEHLEDYFFWAELSFYTKIVNLKDVLLKYRWHEENVSATQNEVQYKKATEVILFKLRSIPEVKKYSEEQMEKISKLLYIPDENIKKIPRSEFHLILKAFKDIYRYFISKNVTEKVLKKFSDRTEKIIDTNPFFSMKACLFILTSPLLHINLKRKMKLLCHMIGICHTPPIKSIKN
jgi:glycosyltransferase involved in cell wall biosynthesis